MPPAQQVAVRMYPFSDAEITAIVNEPSPGRWSYASTRCFITASAAWRSIAKKLVRHGKVYKGLCFEVDALAWKRLVYPDVAQRMRTQLRRHLGQADAFAPLGTHHEERALMALLLAEEAADEARRERQARAQNPVRRRFASQVRFSLA